MVEAAAAKLRKLLTELEKLKGRHTELVSVFIPKDYSVNEVMNQIRNERGTAENIKSKSTRKNVVDALTKIEQHLKLYKATPPNGVAIFCGNVAESEGVTDIKLWAIEPPEPLKVRMYWCDQHFELGPLKDMIAEKELYGLVVMDTQEATIGLLRGKSIQVLRRLESIVPGKTAKGGQSSVRFARVREGLVNDFYKQIAEQIRAVMPSGVKGIVLGGPGPSKEDFWRGEYLQTDVKNKVLGMQSVSYTDEAGLHELVERSKELLAEASVFREKVLLQKFFTELQKDSGMVTYGIQPVLKALEAGAVETLLISDGLDWKAVELTCGCGWSGKRYVRTPDVEKQACAKCGRIAGVIGTADIVDAFEDLSKSYGTTVEVVSTETREGGQLAALGGIAALLRYRYERT
jgi:peptide chain release factor subunit 1